MKLPEKLKVMVITLSDRAAAGEYADLSGPAVKERVTDFLNGSGRPVETDLRLIPDDRIALTELLADASREYNVLFTTGGTGIGPRDITVDVVKPLLKYEIPGIMEMIRIRYGAGKPNALLSRGISGVCGNALIFTLPGSVRAVNEYLDVILPLLEHAIDMQYGIDSHGRHHG
ncbi:MAG: MogA/MoaB family molybdenum cofactor biosynthesis protein [Bacteroidales bacterium]|jgi:molybdenum cofactor synthesis domain-containing protein|nr:MogA/MoaB family molybdenum cofactor biosynthesis protein [Bacteroidales bacterium]